MAFDGLTVAALTRELSTALKGARISKIAQPESDELMITFKTPEGARRLLLSADASLPLAYLTEENKPSPMTAPGFCMLLRKHIGSGRVLSVTQPSLERIIRIDIEHLDEMGDLCTKALIIELMGKHSNIIFCRPEGEGLVIIDSIKHVSSLVSSVREVLPGREYFIPNTMDKLDPLSGDYDADTFISEVLSKPMSAAKAIYSTFTGISPVVANQLVYSAGADGDAPTASLSELEKENIWNAFRYMTSDVKNGRFSPEIVYETGSNGLPVPKEFCALHLSMFEGLPSGSFDSMSALLEAYYAQKNRVTRIRQRSADLRRIVTTCLERCVKKYDIQQKQLKDTEKADKNRLFGELLLTYAHSVPAGAKSVKLEDYNTGEEVTIPLDENKSPQENSRRYFDKYGKLKRTKEALDEQIKETVSQKEHLESILTGLDLSGSEEDLAQIRTELEESGYIRKKSATKKQDKKLKPLRFVSSDGYEIYVGRNNLQNDYVTFKLGSGNDWWFHAKKMPGSHVLVKNKGTEEMPDRVFEEAAALAACYSGGRDQTLVEVDYIQKKHVKKPGGAKPGFVVYYTNYSMTVGAEAISLAASKKPEA